jgi:signal transduction histidine kinase
VEPFPELATLLAQHSEAIVQTWMELIREIPDTHYQQHSLDEISRWLRQFVQAVMESTAAGSTNALEKHLAAISPVRSQLGFDIAEIMEGFLFFREAVLPFIGRTQASSPLEAEATRRQLDVVVRHAVRLFGRIYAAVIREQDERLAVIEERQRLARELHDSVAQALYTVTLYADAADLALSHGHPDDAAGHVHELRDTAQEALRDMRLLIFELRPHELEKEGLVAALQARLEAVEARAGLQTDLQVEGQEKLPVPVEEALYRISQEALNNTIKHAHAQRVSIRLCFSESAISLEIGDDGMGFDPAVASGQGGLGLRGMEERVQKICGRLEIESTPGQGTRIRVQANFKTASEQHSLARPPEN